MRATKLFTQSITALTILALSLFTSGSVAAAQEQENILHNFIANGRDGSNALASLIQDAAGNLYGTAEAGGAYTYGVVFELTPNASGAWTEKILHNFSNGADGGTPLASLIFDAAGNLYSTTASGGAYGYGVAFELLRNSSGGWSEKVLHSFGGLSTDGQGPGARLIFDNAGNLYGTTGGGGAYNQGTVFELTPSSGGGWSEMVLYSFGNSTTNLICPCSSVVLDASGNLYGVTYSGGALGAGNVFELTPQSGGWSEKVLHNFGSYLYGGYDGYYPDGALIFDGAGNLYGTTVSAGNNFYGTVYELTPNADGSWTEKRLHDFSDGADGGEPYGALVFDAAGNLYGTTQVGGSGTCGSGVVGCGTVFKLTPTSTGLWKETVLHNFESNGTDGVYPYTGLTIDASGDLYGVTFFGGTGTCYDGCGTVFEVKPW